jgi:ABC-type maltose transport system permease subunit
MISILLFTRQFTSTIVSNVLLPEQLESGFSSAGLAKFGVSFWLFSAGTLLLFVPCILIFTTTSREAKREKTTDFDNTALMY